MTRHDFMIKLSRDVTPAEVEALYEAGCSDAAIETGPLGAMMDFSREAPSLAGALTSAVRDIEKIQGLTAVGVVCEGIVSLADIAARTGVTPEAARLWSTGQRGPGGFPKPVAISRSGEKGWDWMQVAHWLDERWRTSRLIHVESELKSRIQTLCTADRVLVARYALRSEPDDSVREELERLLEDA